MKKIAIIPARGGSKRIPRKNIKEFLGKPIIAYSVKAALGSKLFDEVMVSTDDAEIAKLAEKFGANVPFMRSKKNSNNFATTAEVIIEVLNGYKKLGKTFTHFCCIYPTAPFITSEKLINSYKLMIKNKCLALIPVVKYDHPIQRSFKICKNEALAYIFPVNKNRRSQDLKITYHDAGQFYWCHIKSFLKYKSLLIPKKTTPFILSGLKVQDIDNEIDWKLAEVKFILFKGKKYDS